MPKVLADEERDLWSRYFRWIYPVANEFNSKYWPVMTMIKPELQLERARYIGTCVYAYQALRCGWLLSSEAMS
jgi:hypothetical protein